MEESQLLDGFRGEAFATLPGLDGGRLIFLLVEAVRRKPIPPEKEGMVHAAGLGLLLVLILFITYKDIIRLFSGV